MNGIGIKYIQGKGIALRQIDKKFKKHVSYPEASHSLRLRTQTQGKPATQVPGLQNKKICKYTFINAQVNMYSRSKRQPKPTNKIGTAGSCAGRAGIPLKDHEHLK